MWIGFTGPAGVGKDTVGAVLVEQYGFRRMAFADKVKELAQLLDPVIDLWPEVGHRRLSDLIAERGLAEVKKIPDVRQTYQRIGTELGRHLDPDIWIKQIEATPDEDVVFTDVRFPNEVDFIQTNGGLVVRLYRDRAGLDGELAAHSSENQQLFVDLAASNNGTPAETARTILGPPPKPEVDR